MAGWSPSRLGVEAQRLADGALEDALWVELSADGAEARQVARVDVLLGQRKDLTGVLGPVGTAGELVDEGVCEVDVWVVVEGKKEGRVSLGVVWMDR